MIIFNDVQICLGRSNQAEVGSSVVGPGVHLPRGGSCAATLFAQQQSHAPGVPGLRRARTHGMNFSPCVCAAAARYIALVGPSAELYYSHSGSKL